MDHDSNSSGHTELKPLSYPLSHSAGGVELTPAGGRATSHHRSSLVDWILPPARLPPTLATIIPPGSLTEHVEGVGAQSVAGFTGAVNAPALTTCASAMVVFGRDSEASRSQAAAGCRVPCAAAAPDTSTISANTRDGPGTKARGPDYLPRERCSRS